MQNYVSSSRIVLIGGDERALALEEILVGLRVFPSTRFAGAGSINRALATISSGTTDVVVVLCRWLGHSDYHVIARLCRQQGVQLLRVQGGFSAARKVIAKVRGEA